MAPSPVLRTAAQHKFNYFKSKRGPTPYPTHKEVTSHQDSFVVIRLIATDTKKHATLSTNAGVESIPQAGA